MLYFWHPLFFKIMKLNYKVFVVGLLISGLSTSLSAQTYSGKSWQLKFEDNFDANTLDQSKWSFGFGWGTNSGSFIEKNRPSNLTFQNGFAVIKAESENNVYYSAAINTRNKMVLKRGYWEARIRVSQNVSGCIPAFWQKLNSDIWPPEVDIMEYFGAQKTQALTVHYKNQAGENKQSGSSYNDGDMTTDFHVYGVEFNEQFLRWFTDGKMVREITLQSHPDFFRQWTGEDKYTMLNIHLADNYAWLGKVDKSKLPIYMHIDYFRIYEEVPTKANNQISNKGIRIHPNPAQQKALLLNDITESGVLQIFNLRGTLVFEDTNCILNNYELNVSGLSSGIYFVWVKTPGQTQSAKLLIN